MIYGIGTDIVCIARIASALQRHGTRFAERILAASELQGYSEAVRPEHFLAKRFAAKEAAAKAFGTGFSDGLCMRDIAVTHDSRGRPLLSFSGRAKALCEELGIGEHFLSVSDERDNAIAYVILMRKVTGDR
jgi:holo-[acyl-carrier protein] synthase